LPPTTGV